MKEAIKTNIRNSYFNFDKNHEIIESDSDYSVNVKNNRTEMFCIEIAKMKEKLVHKSEGILVNCNKDCDAVFIDAENKLIYLIELKRSPKSANAKKTAEQLVAAEKWVEIVFFWIKKEEELREYTKYKIKIIQSAKGNKQLTYNRTHHFYQWYGPHINLDYIDNLIKNNEFQRVE